MMVLFLFCLFGVFWDCWWFFGGFCLVLGFSFEGFFTIQGILMWHVFLFIIKSLWCHPNLILANPGSTSNSKKLFRIKKTMVGISKAP